MNKQTKSSLKKIVSLLLVFMLLIGSISQYSFAAEPVEEPKDAANTEAVEAAPKSEEGVVSEEPEQKADEVVAKPVATEEKAEEVKEEVKEEKPAEKAVEEVKEEAPVEETEETLVEKSEKASVEKTDNSIDEKNVIGINNIESKEEDNDLDNLGKSGVFRKNTVSSFSYKQFNSKSEPVAFNSTQVSEQPILESVKNEGPVIGVDHPKNPGEVMIYKQAKPVEGKVNTWDVTLRMEAKDKTSKTSVVVVIDRSGSMNEGTKLEDAKTAASSFVNSILNNHDSNTKIGLVSYSSHHGNSYTTVTKESDLTTDSNILNNKINNIVANGGTNTQAGLIVAQDMLLADNEAENKYIILLSDGEPTASLDGVYYVGSGKSVKDMDRYGNLLYDHGAKAIQQAGEIKSQDIEIFTVAAGAGRVGNEILKSISSKDSNAVTTEDSTKLTQIFQDLAGRIASSMKNSKVIDPMGQGITVSDIPLDASFENGTLSWDSGSLTKEVEGKDGLKYAEITYRVEITDEILKAQSDDNGFYNANGDASVTYNDVDGVEKTLQFPKPLVNPVFFTVSKEVKNSDGKEEKADEDFVIQVEGTKITLNTKDGRIESSRQTTLRDFNNIVEEIFTDNQNYFVTYTVNGEKTDKVNVNHSSEDVKIEVVNTKKDVKVALSASKVLTGRDLVDGEFSFELKDEAGKVIQTKKNQAGAINFNEIKYTEAGTYKYTISEVNDDKPGVTYDESVINVTVTVEDKEGKLVATPSYDVPAVFNNTYKAKEGSVVIEANKKLEGMKLEAGMFSFELLEGDKELQTVTNNEDGKVIFAPIVYDAEGTHTYIIREKAGNVNGMTYDTKEVKVTVEVKDVDGQLVATPSYDVPAVFNNTYKAKEGSVVIEANKKLEGMKLEAGMFSFELLEGDKELQTVTNNEDGKVIFAPIVYDAEGTHTYIIREKAGNVNGMTYDTEKVTVTVEVKDVDGQLVATPSYDVPAVFNNTYKAKEGSVVIEANKKLEGMKLEAGMFSFELLEGDKELQTVTNNEDGKVIFAPIVYDAEGTHTYIIREKAGNVSNGMTYDTKEVKVTVEVKDVDGQLVATPSYDVPAVFNNTYKAKEGSVVIEANKKLEGMKLEAGMFSFELLEGDKELQTVTNNEDGKVIFAPIVYDAEGTHTYIIREKAGNVNGMTYDTEKVTVTVEVKDVDGQLVATPSYDVPAVFNNTYKAKEGSVVIEANKKLEGMKLEAGMFSFELLEGDKELQTVTNNEDGKVIFAPIVYDAEGTHTYIIREKAGNVNGMTYDTKEVKVTVEVKDVDGQLVATAVYSEENPTFNNTYKSQEVEVVIETEKRLEGRDLKDGEFTFELKDSEGKVIQTVTNKDGKVVFEPIKYTEPGTYKYTIEEVKGEDKDIIYDGSKIEVTVVVEEKDGKLVATVSYSQEGKSSEDSQYAGKVVAEVVPQKNSLTWEEQDADFLIIRPTSPKKNPLVIWTLEEVADKEAYLENLIVNGNPIAPELAEAKAEDIVWYSGTDVTMEVSKGTATVKVSETGLVTLDFSHKNVWTHFAWGHKMADETIGFVNIYKPVEEDDEEECPECPECPDDKGDEEECPECPECPDDKDDEDKPGKDDEDKPECPDEEKPGKDDDVEEGWINDNDQKDDKTAGNTKSPKTGDAGVAPYAIGLLLAVGTFVGLQKSKKKDDE